MSLMIKQCARMSQSEKSTARFYAGLRNPREGDVADPGGRRHVEEGGATHWGFPHPLMQGYLADRLPLHTGRLGHNSGRRVGGGHPRREEDRMMREFCNGSSTGAFSAEAPYRFLPAVF
jgi:hypothetical protein